MSLSKRTARTSNDGVGCDRRRRRPRHSGHGLRPWGAGRDVAATRHTTGATGSPARRDHEPGRAARGAPQGRRLPSGPSSWIRRVLTSAHGFTLLELFIVITLVALFLGAVYETVIVGLRTVNAADDRETIRSQLTSALDRFVRDASVANNVDLGQDAQFQCDTPSVNNVNYQYSNGVLTRQDASSSQITILSNLTAFDFDYIDVNGTSYASCDNTSSCGSRCCRSNARVVEVSATVTKDTETITVATAAFLRNM